MNCRKKATDVRDRARDVAHHDELRLLLLALLEHQLERHAAVGHVLAHGGLEVELAAPLALAAHGDDALQLLSQPLDHLAQPPQVLLGQVVEALLEQALAPEALDVVVVLLVELALGVLPDRAAHRLLDRLQELAQLAEPLLVEALLAQPVHQTAQLPGRALHVHLLGHPAREEADLEHVPDVLDLGLVARLLDQLLEGVRVHREQRLGEIGQVDVHVLEQAAQLLHQLLEVEPLGHAAERLLHLLPELVVEARPEQVEEPVVGVDLVRPLHHGRAQHVLEELAVLERHLVERAERVERLGDRDAHPRLAQQIRELDQLLLHV